MKNNKTLVIITNEYPYNNGETFLENEISFLSNSFEIIYIFSVLGKSKNKPTRFFPSNVKCFPLNCNHNRIKYCANSFFSKDNSFDLNGKNILKSIINHYLYGRNKSIYNRILKLIIKNHIILNNCVIYSYWLTLGIANFKLKNYIENKYGYTPLSVSRCHGYDLYSETNGFNYQPLQEKIINSLDFVCPCSESGKEYLLNKYPNISKKIIVSKLGTKYHKDFNFDSNFDFKNFVTCSGLRPVKRLDLFAKGFSLAAKKNKNIFWTCIGEGKEIKKIKKIIKRNHLSDCVDFKGNLSNKEVYDFYRNNSIYSFVNVSSSEGIPVAIMEAISFGLPVIATDVGGNHEIVNMQNGFLIKKDCSADDICDAISKMCNLDSTQYLKLRMNSRKMWENNFEANKTYKVWCDFLVSKNIKKYRN